MPVPCPIEILYEDEDLLVVNKPAGMATHGRAERGDATVASIAAASILAKTHRDAVMVELDRRYPGYGFAENKGYGTAAHLAALEKLGPSPVHRKSFAPVKKFYQTMEQQEFWR